MERITFEVDEHVVKIGLNRAAKRNAFDLLMLEELALAYTDYEKNDQLWCAVLFAHGDHFTAGLELNEVGPAIVSGRELFPKGLVDPLGLGQYRRTKPVIIALSGYCLTIGIELALASDIRIASENTKFGQIEIKRGILPFGGATMRMPQQLGWGNAMRYLLTGDMFDAKEAYRIGLIQEIVPHEQLLSRAIALGQTVAKQAPLGVQQTLASARNTIEQGFEAEVTTILTRATHVMNTEDAHEGVRSFIERRDGVFKGR